MAILFQSYVALTAINKYVLTEDIFSERVPTKFCIHMYTLIYMLFNFVDKILAILVL